MARILVIEDNPEVRSVILQALEYAGHRVLDAEDGWKGLVQFRRGGADLVILDVTTAEPESHTAIDEIRSLGERVKLLALSCGGDGWDAAGWSVVSVGADGVLAKPFTLLDLMVAVEGLLPGCHHPRLVEAS